ncbi:MAG TPA: FMN-binding protein [Bacillota bacterium]|nr:FMN-binding protein [Bacillota bacterium]HPT88004.1 FMN-binding protein [Bacillota bacterium]
MKDTKRMRRKFGLIVAIVIAAGMMVNCLYMLSRHRETVRTLTISNVDLNTVEDGTYRGSSEAILVAADVEVVVEDHRITEIKLIRHQNGRGKPAEVILEKVIEAQTLQVDGVTGATSSSKVILKAIETALKTGVESD